MEAEPNPLKQLTGRLLEIANGNAGLPAAKREQYRTAFAAQGFELPEVTHHAKTPRPRERVGTALRSKIEGLLQIKTGKGCGCTTLANKMDSWGIAGCEQRRGEIVNHLVNNRAVLVDALRTHGTLGFAAGLAIDLVPEILLRSGANWLLDLAIAGARNAEPKRVHPSIRSIGLVEKCRVPIMAIGPRPFTGNPVMTLICHCWPNGDSWRKHVDYLKPVDGTFNRKIMGVATGKNGAGFDDVRREFGESWEYIAVENDPKLREVKTYQSMLQMVRSTNENDVTFCVHTKGTQDSTAKSPQIQWWTEAMYRTVIYNWQNVLTEMEKGYSIVGSFRRIGAHFKTRYGWHYTGTFYAFRNAAAFASGTPQINSKWWGTESWPGDHFAQHEAACVFADNCGDIYKANPDLELKLTEWRRLNET